MSNEWIQTPNVPKFYPRDPKVENIYISDIAMSLSKLCRFNGFCSELYTVAQHSVYVSEILPDELKLWGLLHDAAEAYISDLPRPIKKTIPEFSRIEEKIVKVIAEKFNLPYPIPEEVMIADNQLLATEARDLCDSEANPEVWVGLTEKPLENLIIEPLNWKAAEIQFLGTFEELTGE